MYLGPRIFTWHVALVRRSSSPLSLSGLWGDAREVGFASIQKTWHRTKFCGESWWDLRSFWSLVDLATFQTKLRPIKWNLSLTSVGFYQSAIFHTFPQVPDTGQEKIYRSYRITSRKDILCPSGIETTSVSNLNDISRHFLAEYFSLSSVWRPTSPNIK